VACEESQAVTIELRALGIEAYSCDVLPCSGGYPEWHLQQDVTTLLCQEWDMILAFPPCTYLTVTGNRWFDIEKYGDKAIQRHKDREQAIKFFMLLANNPCHRIAIENPVGIMSSRWRKPDCIISPHHFGEPIEKRACLWLKNLEPLKATNIIEPLEKKTFDSGRAMSSWYAKSWNLPRNMRAIVRSKTSVGVAKAMANQWGKLLK